VVIVIKKSVIFRRLSETVDNLLDECPNERDVTLVKTTHVDAQHSQDVQMDNLAWYCNFENGNILVQRPNSRFMKKHHITFNNISVISSWSILFVDTSECIRITITLRD
jgi:propanediol dehydratase small subunit